VRTLAEAPHPFKGTEIHTLPGGLTVILKRDPTVPVVALQAWARCGAVDEAPRICGISHGLEHMVFKGTPSRSAGEITRDIESKGGAINAATQLETTHYYIDIPSYGLEPALDVLADAITHPTFPEDELQRERKVILEEIHRRDDSPEATLWDEFASALFKGTPYGTKVIGSIETVSGLSQKDLFDYFGAHYVPENLAMVITGDFDRSKTLKRVERLFKDLPRRPAPAKPVIDLSGRRPGRSVIRKPVELVYMALGHPAPGLGHPDAVGLDLLADVLSGGASARLYQKLREDRQLVLSIACDYIPFSQCGMFALFGEAFPDKADAAIEAIASEFNNLRKDPIRQAELDRARARIKSEWLQGSETPHGRASTLGSLNALGAIDVITSYLKRIDEITVDELMDLAFRHVDPSKFEITLVAPEKKAS
jgi:zinc protease